MTSREETNIFVWHSNILVQFYFTSKFTVAYNELFTNLLIHKWNVIAAWMNKIRVNGERQRKNYRAASVRRIQYSWIEAPSDCMNKHNCLKSIDFLRIGPLFEAGVVKFHRLIALLIWLCRDQGHCTIGQRTVAFDRKWNCGLESLHWIIDIRPYGGTVESETHQKADRLMSFW